MRLRKNATSTSAIRKVDGAIDELTVRFGQSRDTITKWKHRESPEDRSHTPHRLPNTLNDGHEVLVLYLRTTLRLLRRYGAAKLPKEPAEAERPPSKASSAAPTAKHCSTRVGCR